MQAQASRLGTDLSNTGRCAFATTAGANKLLPSGLLGPVSATAEDRVVAKSAGRGLELAE
jgi:hypothetical protein